jgi:hypothetical protein
MNCKKWIELKPIGYVGILLGLGGIVGPKLFGIDDSITLFLGAIVSIIGWYLALYKGRKEHRT